MKTHALLFIGLVGLCASLAGCQEVTIVDDVDLDLDWNPLTGPSDALHTPYVQGASFSVWVNTAKKQSLHGWHMTSADEGVMKLGAPTLSTNEEELNVAATARTPGTVELSVVDSAGEVRHRRTVEVRFPDRVDILPHGPLLLGQSDVPSEERPQVLHNGTATFLVQYSAGGEHLAGHGALEAVSAVDIDAHAEKTSFLEDRDWLVIDTQNTAVTGELTLKVAGQTARTLTVDAVAESAIDHMVLSGGDGKDAHTKDWELVYAAAFDAQARPIYGVEFAFTANAVKQEGFGDLYRYQFDSKLPVMLEATHGVHADGLMIHSSGGFVDSTNRIGCMAVPGSAPTSSAAVGFLLAALYFARRRSLINPS